jgi:pimeloyl-ACP methyl ester carboxylesterase
MIDYFTNQSVPVQMCMLLAHALLVLAAAIACMRWLNTRVQKGLDLVPVAPFFVSVTTVFALFLAFHASTIWSRQHAAEAVFHDAVTAISRLDSLFGKEGVELESARLHLSRYAVAVVREEWANGNNKPSPRYFFQCTGSIRDWNRMDALYELQTPVLLLHGEHDYIVPELATMARDRLPNGQLAFFKGCSHMPFFEDPEGYIRAVSTFLNP